MLWEKQHSHDGCYVFSEPKALPNETLSDSRADDLRSHVGTQEASTEGIRDAAPTNQERHVPPMGQQTQ